MHTEDGDSKQGKCSIWMEMRGSIPKGKRHPVHPEVVRNDSEDHGQQRIRTVRLQLSITRLSLPLDDLTPHWSIVTPRTPNMAPNSKLNAKRKAQREATKPAKPRAERRPTEEVKAPTTSAIPLELQQLLLNIFSNAFAERLSEDFGPLLQEVKGHLYNRDFATAFGKNEYLEAYAARWSASRALGYAELFWDLREQLWPGNEEEMIGGGERALSKSQKVVCLGGGACGSRWTAEDVFRFEVARGGQAKYREDGSRYHRYRRLDIDCLEPHNPSYNRTAIEQIRLSRRESYECTTPQCRQHRCYVPPA
jgi:hypothetical protein